LTLARERRQDPGQIVEMSDDRDAVNAPPDPGSFLVGDAEDFVGRVAVASHFADEDLSRIARADQKNRNPRARVALQYVVKAAILEHPIEQARRTQEKNQHQPIDDQEGARQLVEPSDQEGDREENQQGQGDRADDGQNVVQRGVAPDPLIGPSSRTPRRRPR